MRLAELYRGCCSFFAGRFFRLFFAFSFLAALAVHAGSELPWNYSWWRTLELFWGALTDKYFIVMSFVVLATAVPLKTGIDEARGEKWRSLLVGLLVISCLAVLLGASASYTRWDYLLALPVAFLLVKLLKGRAVSDSLRGLLSTVGALVVVSYIFTILKSQLFVVASPLDDWIVAAEMKVFGVPFYKTVADWAARYPVVVGFCDWIYYLFFHHMALTALFLFILGDRSEQWRYVKGLSLCYLLGGVSYYVFPVMGPVYYAPESFSYLSENAGFTVSIQELLRISTEKAVAGNLEFVETFAFVAGMPSLHMAHETLMLFFVRRSSLMFLLAAVFWAGSALAVLVLGWHYLADILGGILLAAIVLAIVYRGTDATQRRGGPAVR